MKAAGKRFRDGNASPEDSIVLDNWRAAHSYVLNTFQATLRNRARGTNVTVAQRLKRRPTIIDKLRREPSMQLNTMHDMAGCRLIFENIDQLIRFREKMTWSRFRHKPKSFFYLYHDTEHPMIKTMERVDKYNYIENPKSSGYRGIHDVYEYNVNSVGGKAWNGLHVEIQYRTVFQHAWATAVEVADLVTTNRIKFSEGDRPHERFFQLSSELISRVYESCYGPLPQIPFDDVVKEFNDIEHSIGLLHTLKRLRTSERSDVFRKNTLLIFYTSDDEIANTLEIETFDSISEAINRYGELEKNLSDVADVVLVRSDSEASVRLAYRNYFSDTVEFVRYIENALSRTEAELPYIGKLAK